MGTPTQPSVRTSQFGEVIIDSDCHLLRRQGIVQDLSEDAWKILKLLLDQWPKTVSKEELCKAANVTESALPKHVEKIRIALGDREEPHRFIRAERKHGYRFIAPRQEGADGGPAVRNFMALPEPQFVRWGPVDGKPAGITINGSSGRDWVPWEVLKPEVEGKLLNQAVRVIPCDSTVALADFHGRREWLMKIFDPEGKEIGRVWLGPDPDKNWAWDGLVRLGEILSEYEASVWQVYQRYSDGSYRMIAALDRPEHRKSAA